MRIYAMSDIHGWMDAFEDALALVDLSGDAKLILLGDYIHGGPDGPAVLDRIMGLQVEYGTDKVVALLGNHEDMALSGRWPIEGDADAGFYDEDETEEDRHLAWMEGLPRYHVEGNIIFVHAGIDEEAGDLWEWGTDDYTYTEKYPAEIGRFSGGMTIVAGHVGTSVVADDPGFHGIYHDGESHYYIDGTVCESGRIPVLEADTKTGRFYEVSESGTWPIVPYDDQW